MSRKARRTRAAAAVRRVEGSEEGKNHLAVDLKARGKPLPFIARELRCSVKAAQDRLDRALAAMKREAAKEALAVDLELIDRMREGLCEAPTFDENGRVVTGGALHGVPSAVKAMIDILARRAKYLQLDAPDQLNVGGAVAVGPTIFIPAERPDDADGLAPQPGPPN